MTTRDTNPLFDNASSVAPIEGGQAPGFNSTWRIQPDGRLGYFSETEGRVVFADELTIGRPGGVVPGDVGSAIGSGSTSSGGTSNQVAEILETFPWIKELGQGVINVIIEGILNADPHAVITQSIRNTNVYKARFAGLIARQSGNLPAISERQYLDIERGFREQLRQFNLTGTLGLTNEDAFRAFSADLIGSDVSVSEFNRRLDQGQALKNDSSEFVQTAFEQFYGTRVSDDILLTYFLDPDIGLELIEDQLATAAVGGAAFRFGLNVSKTRAEILRSEGVTADLARQGFASIAQEQPVLSRLAQIHSITPLSQQELEEFFFHSDPDVAGRRGRTFTTALAAFQEGGARNLTREGGLGELVERNRAV